MSGLDSLVTVNVSLTSPGVTRQGFGKALLVSHKAAWVERTRTFESAADVLADGTWSSTDPEYLWAVKYFSAATRPPLLMIGRGGTAPTQVQTITVRSATVGEVYAPKIFNQGVQQSVSHTAVASVAWGNSTAYAQGALVTNDTGKLYIATTGGTSAAGPATGPSGAGTGIADGSVVWDYAGAGGAGVASNDAIAYNLMNAFNALAAPAINFTATLSGTAGSKVLVLTADAVGNWCGIECPKRSLLAVVQTSSADPTAGLTAALTAINEEDETWYALGTLFNSELYIKAAAAWAEEAKKFYGAVSCDTPIATDADGGATDVAHDLKGLAYARTFIGFHPRAQEFPDAAKYSYWLPVDPGEDNWRLKTYVGVTPETYTPTERTNILAKNAWFCYVLGGRNTDGGDGKTASGEYVDVTRGVDWWKINLQADGADLLMQNNRVPFTDQGVGRIANLVRLRNERGIEQGVIAPDPEPTVTVPKVADISSSDKADRHLTGVETKWVLAGAINKLTVSATVTQ